MKRLSVDAPCPSAPPWSLLGTSVSRSVPPPEPWPTFCRGCERVWLVNTRTDYRFPKPCGRRTCPRCSSYEAGRIARVLWQQNPSSFLTLTNLPGTWTEIHQCLRVAHRKITRSGDRLCWAYCIERSDLGRPHLHALVKGEVLIEASSRTWGGHVVDIRSARPEHARYMLKGATPSRSLDYDQALSRVADHVDLNGGRLINASRDFWPGSLRSQVRGRASTDQWVTVRT